MNEDEKKLIKKFFEEREILLSEIKKMNDEIESLSDQISNHLSEINEMDIQFQNFIIQMINHEKIEYSKIRYCSNCKRTTLHKKTAIGNICEICGKIKEK